MRNKTSKSLSTTLILAIMLLACLLLNSVGVVNAWFTSNGPRLQISLQISGANVYVVQQLNAQDVVLDSTANNYIDLDKKIRPEEKVPLVLKLKSEESSGLYVRFKFNVYALGQTNINLLTENYILTRTETRDGFVKELSDGYYYYREAGAVTEISPLQKFSDKSLDLLTGFAIDEDDFLSKNINGNTIKVELIVECSDVAW